MNVLIADDNADDRKLLRYNAEKHGCALVIEARDGQEGLELARKHKPDLIVSDALMPRLDGFQFLRALKRDAELRDIPFIFYSAVYTGSKEQELALALGAEGFLVKPQTPEDLWAAITTLLNQRKAPQERPPTTELPEAEAGFLERYSEVVAITLKEKTRALEELLAQRDKAEATLRRLNRELRAISNCNQTLMRAVDEQALLNAICRIVCDDAGYCLAWVGYAGTDAAKTVRAMAWAGNEDGYFATANITWADTEHGRGPAGTAIRTGKTVYIQDFSTDPQFAPWRENALRRGYQSGIALPLKNADGDVFGAFLVYSAETNAFTPDEIRLLAELAGDLAFGITVLRSRAERKQAAEALYEAQQVFRTLVENSPDIIARYDRDCRRTYVNPTYLKLAGIPQRELLATAPVKCSPLPAASAAMLQDLLRQVLASGVVDAIDVKWPKADNRDYWYNICAFPEFDRDGRVASVMTVSRDITDRKRTEMELTLLATVIEQTAETIVITDLNATIIYANPAFEKVTGYTRQEALGQNPRLLQSGRQDAAFYRALWDTLKRGEVWHGHFFNKRKDGTLYEEDAIISPIRDAAGAVANYAAIKRDVTREAQLEQEVQQAQKIDAVGRLAGGIAHDFNNIIEAILGFSEITLATMSPQDAHRQDLLEIQKAGRRAADLTRQLLTFSRRQMIMPVVLDLNTLIANLQKMLTRLIGEDVQLAISLAPDIKFIKADAGQIEQVIMNLAVNARDAMPPGGRLTIGTSAVTVTEADAAAIPDSRPGDFVRLTVADTGAGMAPEVLAHIFEPFFTTKGPDKGTGLGLAVIYGIVKRHDGWIHVSTQVGQGSTFTVYLPAYVSLEPAAAAIAAEATLPPPSGHGEHLLVVEDQADVCNLVVRVLREAGYEVAAATTALSAQRIFDQEGGRFDLVFSDVVLPDQSGFDLVAAFQEWKPGLKVLLCSGYTDERVHWGAIEEKGFHFLQKPYSFAALLRTIRNLLDARAAPG